MTLVVRALVKHFENVLAVRELSFSVAPGECVALIGPNGAGKSTSFACIAGQQRVTSGSVRWNGESIEARSPAERLQRGVARTFQVAHTFEALTVLQNVQLLTQFPRGLAAFDSLNSSDSSIAMELLARVGLESFAAAAAQSLAYGAKKRLELAMALAGLQCPPGGRSGGAAVAPQLLLLDEPAAGLSATERGELMELVRSLAQTPGPGPGRAILYTEHNMDAVFGVADRVLVLIDGELAAQGTAQAVAQDATVRQRYLGQWWSASLNAVPRSGESASNTGGCLHA